MLWTILLLAGQSPSAAGAPLWIDVPFAAQTKDGCGSAAIAMVLQYWSQKQHLPPGANGDPESIQASLFSRSAHGIYASRMKHYFEQAGFAAYPFHADWSDLERNIAEGRPLIVSLKESTALHYVVVTGIDTEHHYVFTNDPARQKMLRSSRAAFESEWSGTQNWALLAVPRSSR